MSRPALLYVRTTAADLGQNPGALLEAPRRYAELRGWPVEGTFEDHAERPTAPRPRFKNLQTYLASEAAAQAPPVVLCQSLPRLFAHGRQMARLLERWLSRGFDVVTIDEDLDTTNQPSRALLFAGARLFHRFETERHTIATIAGMAIAAAKNGGGKPRPKLAVNPLEIRHLWQDKGLSQDATVAALKRRGGRISKGTVNRIIRELLAEGFLDQDAHDAAHQAAKERRRKRQ